MTQPKFSLADLREGRVAVINDGTPDQLIDVLRKAFPKDEATPVFSCDYFYRWNDLKIQWCGGSKKPDIPVQSVSAFLEEQEEERETYKNGAEYEFGDDGETWYKEVMVGPIPFKPSVYNFVSVDTKGMVTSWKFCRPVPSQSLTVSELVSFYEKSNNCKVKIKSE